MLTLPTANGNKALASKAFRPLSVEFCTTEKGTRFEASTSTRLRMIIEMVPFPSMRILRKWTSWLLVTLVSISHPISRYMPPPPTALNSLSFVKHVRSSLCSLHTDANHGSAFWHQHSICNALQTLPSLPPTSNSAAHTDIGVRHSILTPVNLTAASSLTGTHLHWDLYLTNRNLFAQTTLTIRNAHCHQSLSLTRSPFFQRHKIQAPLSIIDARHSLAFPAPPTVPTAAAQHSSIMLVIFLRAALNAGFEALHPCVFSNNGCCSMRTHQIFLNFELFFTHFLSKIRLRETIFPGSGSGRENSQFFLSLSTPFGPGSCIGAVAFSVYHAAICSGAVSLVSRRENWVLHCDKSLLTSKLRHVCRDKGQNED